MHKSIMWIQGRQLGIAFNRSSYVSHCNVSHQSINPFRGELLAAKMFQDEEIPTLRRQQSRNMATIIRRRVAPEAVNESAAPPYSQMPLNVKSPSTLKSGPAPSTKQLAIIFGRTGSDDTNIEMHSKVFEEFGLDTLCSTMPFASQDPNLKEIEGLAPELDKAIKGEHKLIFQLLSANGVRAYLATLDYCKSTYGEGGDDQLVKNTDGIIFDSAPFNVGLKEFAKTARMGVDKLLRSDSLYLKGKSALVLGLLNTKFALRKSAEKVRQINGNEKDQDKPLKERLIGKMPNDQLYLYSKYDAVVDYQEIEEFAHEQMESGVEHLDMVRFVVSAHCRHLHDYPLEYRASVWNFLRKINMIRKERLKNSGE